VEWEEERRKEPFLSREELTPEKPEFRCPEQA
jgi:hypothetical protein